MEERSCPQQYYQPFSCLQEDQVKTLVQHEGVDSAINMTQMAATETTELVTAAAVNNMPLHHQGTMQSGGKN